MQVLAAAVDALASAPERTARWSAAAWSGSEGISSPTEELILRMNAPHAQADPSYISAASAWDLPMILEGCSSSGIRLALLKALAESLKRWTGCRLQAFCSMIWQTGTPVSSAIFCKLRRHPLMTSEVSC